MGIIAADNGVADLLLQPGDEVTAEEAPDLARHGIMIDASFEFYHPAIDLDSTLLAHGDSALGYALHFVAGHPTLSVFLNGNVTAIEFDAIPTVQHTFGRSSTGQASCRLPFLAGGKSSVRPPSRWGFRQSQKPGFGWLRVLAFLAPRVTQTAPRLTDLSSAYASPIMPEGQSIVLPALPVPDAQPPGAAPTTEQK